MDEHATSFLVGCSRFRAFFERPVSKPFESQLRAISGTCLCVAVAIKSYCEKATGNFSRKKATPYPFP